MNTGTVAGIIACTMIISSCRAPEKGHADEAAVGAPLTALRPLETPAPDGSAQPQLSVAHDGSVILSWLEPAETSRTRLRFAELRSGRWSDAKTVVEGAGFFVNWADVPSVVRLSDGRIAAHWLQKSGSDTYAYDVKLRVSDDNAATWSETLTPHRDGTQSEHGFVSMFDAPGGGLGLVWLDGREMSAGGHDSHDGNGGAGAMTLRSTTLGRDRTLGPEQLIDDRVCECCPTTAVRAGDRVLVAYRNRGEKEEIRDIHVARYADGAWSRGTPVHSDNWLMPACPVNGPSLAADDRRVTLTWFTAEDNAPRVMMAFSSDGGATFGAPVRVDDGVALGRVDSELLPDGSALVGWVEFKEPGSEFRVRRVLPNGTRGASMSVTRVSSDRASGYPRLARSGNTLVFAWTEVAPGGGKKRVRAATGAL